MVKLLSENDYAMGDQTKGWHRVGHVLSTITSLLYLRSPEFVGLHLVLFSLPLLLLQ